MQSKCDSVNGASQNFVTEPSDFSAKWEKWKNERKQVNWDLRADIPESEIPTLYGHLIGTDYYGDGIMLVWCPKCDQYHRHGWTGDEAREHKAGRCQEGGYYIAAPGSQDVYDDPFTFDGSLWDHVHDLEIADGDALDPYRLATIYISQYPNTVYWREDFWDWDRPAYKKINTTQIEKRLLEIIKSQLDEDAEKYVKTLISPSVIRSPYFTEIKKSLWHDANEVRANQQKRISRTLISNILGCLRALCEKDGGTRDAFWMCDGNIDTPDTPLLIAKNCLVFDGGDHFYGAPLSPQFFATSSLDYEFDPTATCPRWMKFIDEILGESSDCAQALQEVMGCIVSGETKYQKIAMLLGVKRSGKGTVARVLSYLIGIWNVCNPSFKSLQSNFGMQPFLGKSLAIVGDARLSKKAETEVIVERLLSISGEDAQTVDVKYKPQVTTQLDIRFLILSNETPKLNDASATLPSRCLPIPFNQSFYGRENLNLTKELLQELPGILNWSLDGLKRLREQGRFTEPSESDDIRNKMEDEASPVLAFVKECCIEGIGSTPVDDMFAAWQLWCWRNNQEVGTTTTFGRNLKSAVNVDKPRRNIDGKRVNCYSPITLKTDEKSNGDSDKKSKDGDQFGFGGDGVF